MPHAQSTFSAALLDPGHAVPNDLIDGNARPAGKRFDVYRNNVVLSLIDALRQSFPAIETLLGEQNFSSLAGLYVRAHPPSDPRMMLFGAAFPTFLEEFSPLAHLAYLADVARLELALRRSYHAADNAPCDPNVFSKTPPGALASATVTFSQAMILVRSSWPILDIWHFNMTPGARQPQSMAQDVLVTRPEFDPEIIALRNGGADLIEALMQGAQLGAALERVEEYCPEFDFPDLLIALLKTGSITGLKLN